MPSLERPSLERVARIGASFAVLALLAWLVPTDNYLEVLSRADWLLAFASVALLLPEQMIKARLFWLTARLQNLAFSYRKMLAIQFATGFYGLIVPGQVGAVAARWYKLQKPGRQRVEAAAVIGLNRLLETATGVIIGLTLALADPLVQQHVPILLFLAAALVACGLAIAAFVRPKGRELLKMLERGLPAWRLFRPWRQLRPAVGEAVGRFSRMRREQLAKLLFWSLLWHAIGILIVVLAARAVGSDVGWTTLGWVRSFLAIALLLPISWAGIGLREVGFVALLAPYGVPAATAVAIGLLGSLRLVVIAAIGGLVEALLPRRTRPDPALAPSPRAGRAATMPAAEPGTERS